MLTAAVKLAAPLVQKPVAAMKIKNAPRHAWVNVWCDVKSVPLMEFNINLSGLTHFSNEI